MNNQTGFIANWIAEQNLAEAKPEFEVKVASSKKGPIKVTKFMTLGDAKEFLAQQKKEGMNGIISKGGKPVKEEVELDEGGTYDNDRFLIKGNKAKLDNPKTGDKDGPNHVWAKK